MIHITPGATDVLASMVLHRNVMAEGGLWFSSQAADGAAANALGPQTYDFWTPTAVPAWLGVTLPAPVECDACAIIAHNLGSKGATVDVMCFDPVAAADVVLATISPSDDRDILVLFDAPACASWWIKITGAIASVGVLMFGPRLLIPWGITPDYTPINLALSVELAPNITRGGQFLGNRIQRIGAGTSIQLAPQEREWIEQDARAFIAHYNAGKPFIWASCPEVLSDDMAYCWRSGGVLSASYGAGAVYGSMSMEVAAYVGS